MAATQERSLQDTLYDGGGGVDLVGSHNFIISAVKLIDNSVTEEEGLKHVKLGEQIAGSPSTPQEIVCEIDGPNSKDTGAFASLHIDHLADNDLVITGEESALVDQALKLIIKKSNNSAEDTRASKN